MKYEKGTLARWVDDRGFGFIQSEDKKQDVFIHISALKNMGRRPIDGDIIHYQLSIDHKGKTRAVNAIIEGVSPANRKVLGKAAIRKNPFRRIFDLLLFPLLIYSSFFAYGEVTKDKLSDKNFKRSFTEKKQTEKFKCTGKTWCSEMTSCKEAKFYLYNCPGTKMDGDKDGVPCENQWCY